MILHQNRHISAELSITSVSLLRMIRYENLRRHPNTASEDIDLCFRLSLPLLMAPTHTVWRDIQTTPKLYRLFHTKSAIE